MCLYVRPTRRLESLVSNLKATVLLCSKIQIFAIVSASSASRIFCQSMASKCDVHQEYGLTALPTAVQTDTLALRIQRPVTVPDPYAVTAIFIILSLRDKS